MLKGTFGIVAGLALTLSPAWAGDEKPKAKAADKSAATVKSAKATESATGGVVEVASARRALAESKEVRTSHEARWMIEREGYRDGGY
jgi:hypothetical protein